MLKTNNLQTFFKKYHFLHPNFGTKNSISSKKHNTFSYGKHQIQP